jgi:hypothetical protein
VVLQLTVFWYIGAVLGHVCLGLGVLALVTMLLSWVFFFPQWGLGVCVVLWSVGCKSIQFLVHSFMHSKEPTHGLRNTHPQPSLFHIHPTLPHSHGNHRAVAASAARGCAHRRLGADTAKATSAVRGILPLKLEHTASLLRSVTRGEGCHTRKGFGCSGV